MKVFVSAHNVISPLGQTSDENFNAIKLKKSGVKEICDEPYGIPYYGSKLDWDSLELCKYGNGDLGVLTKLEALAIASISKALESNTSINSKNNKTLFILSTTKGNIDLLTPKEALSFPENRKYLWKTGEVIASHFENPNKCLVVSNACISGVLAIVLAKRWIKSKKYDTVVVVGVDLLTPFVTLGFASFKALADGVCKPYDKNRTGINLGEACSTIILQNKDTSSRNITVLDGAISSDANHISGPSRDGEGLYLSIRQTLKNSNVEAQSVDYISGHGTSTAYNDEMESLAVHRAGLSHAPMNSMKGYFGHTLGAAGVLESVMTIKSLEEDTIIGTYNFSELGVSSPVNIQKDTEKRKLKVALKTAAGFGGCNASVLFRKEEIE